VCVCVYVCLCVCVCVFVCVCGSGGSNFFGWLTDFPADAGGRVPQYVGGGFARGEDGAGIVAFADGEVVSAAVGGLGR
jgi:hypothetical protein